MGISWILAPLLFYIILTQSKTLGQFKWLILNYSFWTLCISTYFGLIKPIILTPAFSVIHIGILRNYGNYYSTFVLGAFAIALSGITMGSLCAAMTFRYLMVFPSVLKKIYNFKMAIFFMGCATFVTFGLLAAGLIFLNKLSLNELFQQIQKDEPILAKYINTDNTFFVVPLELYEILIKITVFLLFAAHAAAVFLLFFFRYQMHKYSIIVKNNTNHGIIISIIVQFCITMLFLISPYTFIFSTFAFQIPNTATFSVILLCIFCSHSFVDFCSTLYFVTPYRKFVAEFIRMNRNKVIIVPPSTNAW